MQPAVATDVPQLTYRYRTSRVAFGTFFLLVGAAFLLDSMGTFRVTTNIFWPLFIVSLCAGLLLHRARRIMVEEDRSAQLAVAEERVRIARELHDIVAHGVSLMTIQIAAARRVAVKNPDSSAESLEAAEETGRQTLSELEGMLAALRGADASIGAAAGTGPAGDAATGRARPSTPAGAGGRSPLPRIADLDSLIETVRQTGRTIRYNVLGDAPPLPSSVETTVYRLVQEAVTNAVRYAGDTPIDVQVIFSPTAITVFVDDEGAGPTPTNKGGGGHGLVGMRERLGAIGGSLESGPRTPGPGWRVYATIPLLLLEAS
ncbi:MAG TPA: histidine kinase [Acidimicrobiales bacterium]|jgi:signal transduction histidine kinase|nr:histidine kinase [Acidimicrobiales bacterium]